MTEIQPVALRLADEFDSCYSHYSYKDNVISWGKDASVELRRLHAQRDEMLSLAQKIAHGNFSPVDWVQEARAVIAKATGETK